MPRLFTINRTLRRGFAAAALGMLAATPAAIGAQTGSTGYTITNLDPDKFPKISFQLRAVDASGNALGTLNNNNLGIFENGQPVPAQNVTLTRLDKNKVPMVIVFVIDTGNTNNFAQQAAAMRVAIRQLLDSKLFIEGVDTVKVLSRENFSGDRTEAIVRETKNAAELAAWIGREDFNKRSPGRTKGLEGVNDALVQDISKGLMPVPGAGPAAIILFSRGIEDPLGPVADGAARGIAADARARGIIIHAIHTDAFAPAGAKAPLQTLAAGTNGRYLVLGPTAGNDMDAIYRDLDAKRVSYQVSYNSALGSAGQRKITVGAPEQAVFGSTLYSAAPKEPVVVIEDPPNNSQVRRELGADNASYRPLRRRVAASVTFVDGFTRTIESAQFLVDGRPDSVARPLINGNKIEFDVDISSAVNQPNTQRVVQLGVRVKDSLGIEASGRSDMNIVAPPLPTPTPQPTPKPEVPEGTTAIPTYVLIAGPAGLLAAGGLGFLIYKLARKKKPPVGEGKTIIVSGSALATLTVLEGPREIINEQIKITKDVTVIGRNPQQTNITFYPDKESSISRVHATVSKKSNGRFAVMDNGSSSGTRLNGRQLQPKQAFELQDGDEIVLGDLGRRGVKMRFNNGGIDANVFGGSDKTRITNLNN